MNNYRLLGLLLLATALLLTILTFRPEGLGIDYKLILTYEVGVKFSLIQFRLIILGYLFISAGISFWAGNRITLSVRFLLLYISLLILPLTIFTIITMLPDWTILLFFDGGHEPGFYYDYINNYGLFNICLIVLNVLGLLILGLQMIKKLKRT